VPIIEILQAPHIAKNDSTPIAELLNERFTEKDGYPDLKLIEETKKHAKDTKLANRAVYFWICYDVYKNALDPDDGSKEFFKRTREADYGPLEKYLEKMGGSEDAIFQELKVQWMYLKERMAKEDGTGEREFCYSKHVSNAADKSNSYLY